MNVMQDIMEFIVILMIEMSVASQRISSILKKWNIYYKARLFVRRENILVKVIYKLPKGGGGV